MSTNEQRVRGLIAEESADWFVENRAGLNTEQRREFTAWLKTSPVHVEEYLAITALAQNLRAACEPAEESCEQLVTLARGEEDTRMPSLWPLTPAAGREIRSWWQPIAVAASLALLSVGLVNLGHYWPNTQPSISGDATVLHFQSQHGEQQTHQLADHSVIHLNTDTAVTVRFGNKERLVVLEAGEAVFEVAHDARRAFRVSAGSAQVVAIGTKFDVQLGQVATLVTVAEGRVNVGLTSNTQFTMRYLQLGAGQQLRVAEGDWPTRPVAADVERTTAWLHGQIKFNNEPLVRVTSEFNRYAPTPFDITTRALQDLKISGVFATDDTDAFIAFLRSLPGVHVKVTATRMLVSQD
ncbi:MAG: FecR domain-containing protein [Gammaproteobacteria bacterium]